MCTADFNVNSAPLLILYETRHHLLVCTGNIVTRAKNMGCNLHMNPDALPSQKNVCHRPATGAKRWKLCREIIIQNMDFEYFFIRTCIQQVVFTNTSQEKLIFDLALDPVFFKKFWNCAQV